MGRIANIKVPKGCNEIYVDIEDDKVIVSYASKLNNEEFYCSLTGEIETMPKVGDFCIFWNEGRREQAIIANMSGKKKDEDGIAYGYISSNGENFDYAIKFRDYRQYIEVKGIIDDTI